MNIQKIKAESCKIYNAEGLQARDRFLIEELNQEREEQEERDIDDTDREAFNDHKSSIVREINR